MQRKESVEEFLARGGNILTKSPQRQEKILRNLQTVTDGTLKLFYQSPEWKVLRNKVRNELTPFCPVCGSEENLVVDHIKPVRYFWEERLNEENLQILCDDCNLEKGSMVGWSIEYHLKNKQRLLTEKNRKALFIKNAIDREEGKKATSNLTNSERETFQSVWQSYIGRCRQAGLLPVSKYEFRMYFETLYVTDTWNSDGRLKRHIKENFRNIQWNP